MENKPLDKIICDGGMMNIFRTIGCIGDSLSSGEFEYIKDGETVCLDLNGYTVTGSNRGFMVSGTDDKIRL